MPSLELDTNSSKYQIRGYKPGLLRINKTIYSRSLLVSPKDLYEDWRPQHIDELRAEDFSSILTIKPEILLLGTGEKLVFPHITVYGELINQSIGVEIMDTNAACRTFNALSSEGRNVMAALIIY